MDHQKKFLELCGMTTLKEYTEPGTAEELIQSGQYYVKVFDKLTAAGELRLERAWNELDRVLAEGLQPPARAKYGVAGAAAIRQLLTDDWEASDKEDWERQRNLFKTAVGQMGLNQNQEEALLQLMDVFPDLMVDILATEAARLKLIPLENVNEVTRALAQMYLEESDVNQKRDN